jgi:RNA-binding protein
MMDKGLKKRLRAEGQRLVPTIQVGKGGLEGGLRDELDAQLKRNHLVKVRILHGAVGGGRDDEGALAEDLVRELGAELVEKRGHTLLIYRQHRRPKTGGR